MKARDFIIAASFRSSLPNVLDRYQSLLPHAANFALHRGDPPAFVAELEDRRTHWSSITKRLLGESPALRGVSARVLPIENDLGFPSRGTTNTSSSPANTEPSALRPPVASMRHTT